MKQRRSGMFVLFLAVAILLLPQALRRQEEQDPVKDYIALFSQPQVAEQMVEHWSPEEGVVLYGETSDLLYEDYFSSCMTARGWQQDLGSGGMEVVNLLAQCREKPEFSTKLNKTVEKELGENQRQDLLVAAATYRREDGTLEQRSTQLLFSLVRQGEEWRIDNVLSTGETVSIVQEETDD